MSEKNCKCCPAEEARTPVTTQTNIQTQNLKTSQLYRTTNIPFRFEHPDILSGYASQRKDYENPFYITENSLYGSMNPNVHTVHQRFYPRTHTFSSLLAKCGMYRNYALNTAMDKDIV